MEDKKQKKLTPVQEKSRKRKLIEITKDLQSSEDVVVLDALEKVKEHGDSSVIPILVDLYTTSFNSDVQNSVKLILKSLKDKGSVAPLISIIKEKEITDSQKSFLTSIFWEAGFDMKDYLSELIDIALVSDFQTCIEVMTIIENMENVDKELLEHNMIRLKSKYEREKTDKDALYVSMLEIMNEHLIGG